MKGLLTEKIIKNLRTGAQVIQTNHRISPLIQRSFSTTLQQTQEKTLFNLTLHLNNPKWLEHKWAVCESKHFLSAPVTLAFLLFLHSLHLQEFQLVWFNPHWDRDLDLERDLLPKKNTLDQKWNLVVAKHFNHEAFKNQKTIRAQDGVMPYYNKLWTIVTVEPRHNEPL